MRLSRFSVRAGALIGVIILLFVLEWAGMKTYGSRLCEKMIPTEELDFATSFIGLMRQGKFDEVSPHLSGNVKKTIFDNSAKTLSLFRRTEGLPQQFIACHVSSSTQNRDSQNNVDVTIQWALGPKTVLANLAWSSLGEDRIIQKFSIQALPEGLQGLNAWNLQEKGLTHWIFLALALTIPMFIIFTLAVLLKTKVQSKRWLWAIFILVGFWQHTLNWTTGEITGLFMGTSNQILSIQLLGAGFGRDNDFSPLLLTVCVPLGALLFWFQRWNQNADS
jgi:hypothetical protein